MRIAKQVIKQSRLGSIIRLSRARKTLQKWTPHDQALLEFYKPFVIPGTYCFDIGANMGNRVKIFLRLGARVVAVEPQDDCVKLLKGAYGTNQQLLIVQKVLGDSIGVADLMLGSTNTVSSLSPAWIEAVERNGRFPGCSWKRKQVVQMTTLDKVIEEYGVPSFIKIDVEGFEYEVLKGLTRPVRALSLEFTPEFIQSALNCIAHLQELGDIHLNYSLAETAHFVLNKWITAQEMISILTDLEVDQKTFGDIYVQFI